MSDIDSVGCSTGQHSFLNALPHFLDGDVDIVDIALVTFASQLLPYLTPTPVAMESEPIYPARGPMDLGLWPVFVFNLVAKNCPGLVTRTSGSICGVFPWVTGMEEELLLRWKSAP